ncbi:MAG: hypothetical protein H0U58_03130, partial [Chloroflexi bacterium]|nr:hypothetical protein [Chloroflexota bacterium]
MAAERRVHRLRLKAPSEDFVRRGAVLVENALRSASLPDEDGRLLVVRRLDLGMIALDRPPSVLAAEISACFRGLGANAVSAGSPRAATSPAVFFSDDTEPFVELAVRIARRKPAGEWFWSRAVAGYTPGLSADQALRLSIRGALGARAGPAAVLTVIRRVRERSGPAGIDLLLGALRTGDGPVLLRAFGWDGPVPADVETGVPVLPPAEWRSVLRTWAERWGNDDRLRWLAGVAVAVERPVLLGSPSMRAHAATVAQAMTQDDRTITPDVGHSPGRATSGVTTRAAASNGAVHVDMPDVSASTRAELVASLEARASDGTPTQAAGLLFLVALLERIGFGDAMTASPGAIEADVPGRLLRAVATRARVADDDPVWQVAPDRPDGAPIDPDVRRWLRRA